MSCQPLLLYSLIVERSVSHPVRLTAGVPLVTPQCPLPADAIVAATGRRGEPGPAGCETILGRKRRESRSCVQKPGQPSVSEIVPLCLLSPLLPPRIDFVILSPFVCDGNENEDCILSRFFTGFPSSFQRVISAFG